MNSLSYKKVSKFTKNGLKTYPKVAVIIELLQL